MSGALNSVLGEPTLGPTLGDYVASDDGEGCAEHRAWIAKRRKRAAARAKKLSAK